MLPHSGLYFERASLKLKYNWHFKGPGMSIYVKYLILDEPYYHIRCMYSVVFSVYEWNELNIYLEMKFLASFYD